jgi:hypothetical protein
LQSTESHFSQKCDTWTYPNPNPTWKQRSADFGGAMPSPHSVGSHAHTSYLRSQVNTHIPSSWSRDNHRRAPNNTQATLHPQFLIFSCTSTTNPPNLTLDKPTRQPPTMNRLFGAKNNAPKPTLTSAISNVRPPTPTPPSPSPTSDAPPRSTPASKPST